MKNQDKGNKNQGMSFREIRYRKKREAIIESAVKLFGAKGFHGATIEEITNELTMTKGSFYYYFLTKEDILFEVHVWSLQKVLNNIIEINQRDDPPEVKIKDAISDHLKFLSQDLEGAFALQYEFPFKEKSKKKIMKMRDLYEKNFVDIVQKGIDKGVFCVKNARLATFIILGAINWFLRWYSSSGAWNMDFITQEYVDLLCNGLVGPYHTE